MMACMAERDLECFLCQQHFTAMYGDLIIAEEIICDDCLAELGQLEESELRQRVSERLAQCNITDPALEEWVVQNICRCGTRAGNRGLG